MSNRSIASLQALRRRAQMNNSVLAPLAYGGLCLVGALLLVSPLARSATVAPVSFLDALFIATSAVSTTGLVTIDPGSTFSFAGQALVLLLIQIGGLGYMTLASFAFLAIRDRLTPMQSELTRAGFGLNGEYSVSRFLRVTVISALCIEAVGALILSYLFALRGVAEPVWSAIFHSVSAFCTAGFSLFPNSLENFSGDGPVLMTIAVLSYLGAMGFVVIAEFVDWLTRPRRVLSPTTSIIFKVTAGMAVAGTLFLLFFEPTIAALPKEQRLLNAFFQAMTASTTVGFNSVAIGALAPASVIVMYFLMFVGASPSGTGGGLKSTTAALLVATVISVLRGRDEVRISGVRVPELRVRQASATLIVGLFVVLLAVVALDLTGSYKFDQALFEVFSALGTVGLSMGVTGALNEPGKWIIIAVMFIGRVGVLLFFISFAGWPEDERPVRERDVLL